MITDNQEIPETTISASTPATTADPKPAAANGMKPDGSHRLKIGGREFTIRPMIFAGFDEKERFIVDRRPSVKDQLAEIADVPEELRQPLLQKIVSEFGKARFVTFEEEAAFDKSVAGLGFAMWRSLRTDQPEVDSVDAARAILESISSSEALALLPVLGIAG